MPQSVPLSDKLQSQKTDMLTSCRSQVVGTVTRITRQAATLSLLTVDGRPCRPDFTGIIRSQDVRQTAKDSVKVRMGSDSRSEWTAN